MKIWRIVFCLAFVATSCNDGKEVFHNKDLGQNMMDLRIYQENLGDQIKNKKLQDASWLLEGMDSILLLLNKHFKEHRKLTEPFAYHYKHEMKEPIRDIRSSIKNNDTARALKSYRILVRNCNSCHIDHDVNKEVWY